jgi:hypothetical protein
MILSQVNNAYVSGSPVSAMYLGTNKVWPVYTSGSFWYGFSTNSCITLILNSSQNIPQSGIVWGDGSISNITNTNATYVHSYGKSSCNTALYSGIMAFYNFDGDINDATTNGYNLTAPWTPYQQGGSKIGSASALFTSFGSCGSGPGFSYPTNPFNLYTGQSASFSMWYYPTQSITFRGGCAYTVFGSNFGNFGLNASYGLGTTDTLLFNIANSNVTITGNQMSTGNWYHYVCTHDAPSKTLTVYQNGNLVGSRTYTSISAPSQNYLGFAINGSAYGAGIEYGVPCKMDAIGIWKRALTSGDVSLLFNSGNAIQYPF